MKFIIRDLLWLMVVCAVASYAYRDHRKMELRVAEMEVERAKEKVRLANWMAHFEREQAFLDTMSKINDEKLRLAREVENSQRENRAEQLDWSFPVLLFYDPAKRRKSTDPDPQP